MIASDDYFRAMDIPLLRRTLLHAVRRPSSATQVVHRERIACARATGRTRTRSASASRPTAATTWFTIVGVVADVRQQLALAAGRRDLRADATDALRHDQLGDPLDHRSSTCWRRSCATPSATSIPTSRSTACARWTTCERRRSRRRGSRQRCSDSSPRWRSSSPRPGSPASSRSRSVSGRRSSACASRSAPRRADVVSMVVGEGLRLAADGTGDRRRRRGAAGQRCCRRCSSASARPTRHLPLRVVGPAASSPPSPACCRRCARPRSIR